MDEKARYVTPAKQLAECSNCGLQVGEGDGVIYDDGHWFCDYRCHLQWMSR